MADWVDKIGQQLLPFKRKHYLNLLVRGSLLTAALLLTYFLAATAGEHFLWFDSWVRFFLFAFFLALLGFCYWRYLHQPIRWFLLHKGMEDEDAARRIGASDPSVQDRLLNMLQLARQQPSVLVEAGINQKFQTVSTIDFRQIIDLRINRRFLPYAIAPLTIILALLLWNNKIILGSTERILNFNKAYSPEAPFRFEVLNESLQAFHGEDYTLTVRLAGDQVPAELMLEQAGLRHTMVAGESAFSYTFEKIQSNQTFRLYAAGFYSDEFNIRVITRPELSALSVTLDFPAYLNMKSQTVYNNGNIEVPEGTRATWNITTMATKKAWLTFGATGTPEPMLSSDNEHFSFNKNLFEDQPWSLSLANDDGQNREKMEYRIKVIRDEYPVIQARQGGDSLFFRNIYLGGFLSDDHGITRMELKWQRTKGGNKPESFNTVPIRIDQSQLRQSFMVPWSLDSLQLQPGEQLDFFLEARDNDGVNGPKATRTGMFSFRIPDRSELDARTRAAERETSGDIRENLEKAKTLSESIEEAQQKLRGKQSMDWQDKARVEDIIRQKQEMEKALEELQKQNKQLNEQRSSFDEQDERIREKTEQLQKLMEDLLDEETKKLFRELEKLLRDNANPDQMQKMLDKIQRNEINLEKELDRIKELFKQLQLEAKIDQSINRLDETIRKQEELLKNTPGEKEGDKKDAGKKDAEKGKGDEENGDKSGDEGGKQDSDKSEKSSPEELSRRQEDIRQDLNDSKDEMKELEELGEEAGEDVDVPKDEQFEKTDEEMKKSGESLQKGQPKNSRPSQKKALEQMKSMKQQLSGMQNSMQMEMDEQNLESLRQILHGVLKLSFDQETTMKTFNGMNAADPEYLTVSQHQLKLQEDAKVLEDSLLELSKKDMMMAGFVTREIGELNHHMNRASENIRERRKAQAAAEMQLSMTSMNNLALMLNDHFQQMMEMMSKSGKTKGKGKKKSKMPGLSEMQKKLNEQIEQLKKGGKTGRELSEELAKMAAEQERIRKALQNLEEKLGKQEGGKLGGDLPAKMEQTEIDLVNKRLTEQTIRRQKEILTRLLEAEKSMREQELDQERKGETAKDYEKEIPKAFQEYLKLKEMEAELLKSIPPKLIPYYKKEADAYFERLGKEKQVKNP